MTRERLDEFSYTKKDFRFDWYSGQGSGGQHRNKHQNCLRLTHLPSGITVQSADYKSRNDNIKMAFVRLRPLLEAWIKSQLGETEYPRSDELVRTYHAVDNRVTDHSSGLDTAWSNIDKDFADHILERARAGSTGKKTGR